MIKPLLSILFILITLNVLAQDTERVKVNGKIVVESNDIEGVTVFNTSSDKGTITDLDGKFNLEVGLNDRVEVSALQFKKFTVIIDAGIIQEKKMTVYLVEQVNKLREVVVTPYDLSGNIIVDIDRIETVNLPLEFDLANISVDLTQDYKTRAENPFVHSAYTTQAGIDFVKVVGPLLKSLFKSKNKKNKNDLYAEISSQEKQFDLRDMYANAYMTKFFNIPEEKVNEFIVYVEDKGIDYALLREGREMEFIDFIVAQSALFLKLQSEKD